ncbi:MAG: SDR family oxidoreductase [Gemmatimonadetes bacterium]|nr:SDR family oxidoreductase [Gemmatimonadota bacterium]
MSAGRGSVLVTGASTGFGASTVRRLAAAGWRVFASVRKPEDEPPLHALPGVVTPVRFDVADHGAIAAAAHRIAENVGEAGLDALVNNAGIAIAGPLEFLPISELRHQLEVNLVGQIAVTQALIPLLRRAAGRIIFVGSIAGRSAMPVTGAYSASKFGIEALADALRVELRPWRIRVSVIEPGSFATAIWRTSRDRADRVMPALPSGVDEHYGEMLRAVRRAAHHGERSRPADDVARVIEKALTARRPRARYVVGTDAKLRLVAERLLPTGLRDAVIARRLRRLASEAD